MVGIIELIFFGLFFILMVIGTALDRRYNESPKWWILILGIVLMTAWYWSDIDFSSMWASVQTLEFWKPIGIYLAAGIAYSVLEFIMSVRKLQRSHAESWKKFIDRRDVTYTVKEGDRAGQTVESRWVKNVDGAYFVTMSRSGGLRNSEEEVEVVKKETVYRDIFRAAQAVGATEAQQKEAERLLHGYRTSDEYRMSNMHKDFVEIEMAPVTCIVQPSINKTRLSSFVGAWTLLWPAYAVSLLVGNFLVEVFRVLGDIFINLGGRFVRLTFGDTFKV